MRRAAKLWLAAALLSVGPASAAAQAPTDIASQVGTLVDQMLTRAPTPWLLEAGVQVAADRGNADFDSIGGNFLYLRDGGVWRLGVAAGGARAGGGGLVLSERYAADVAAERPIRSNLRLVVIGDWFRSPLDGLLHRTAAGGLVVWIHQQPESWGVAVFGGVLGVHERVAPPDRTQTLPETLAGIKVGYTPTRANSIIAMVTHLQDLSTATNYRIGTTVSTNAQVVGAMGIRLSYVLGYDHQPVERREGLSQSVSAVLTLTFGPRPAAKP